MSAKAQGVGECGGNRLLPGSVRDNVQLAFFIGNAVSDCGRNDAIPERKGGEDGFHCAGCAKHMAGHGFGGGNGSFGGGFSERFFDSDGFVPFINRRGGAVRVDVVHFLGGDACFLHGENHGFCGGFSVGGGAGDVIGVAGSAVTGNFRINLCAARFGVFEFFQNEDSGTLCHNKAVPFLVKGDRGAVRIFRTGKSAHIVEAGHGKARHGGFCAARNTGVQITVFNLAEGFAHCMGGRGAGGDRGEVCPLESGADGDISSGHIADHHGDKKDGDPLGALFKELFMLRFVVVNTIALRMSWSADDPTTTVAAKLAATESTLLDHHHLPLTEAHRLAGVDELFDSLVVIENLGATAHSAGELHLGDISVVEAPHYPLTAMITVRDSISVTVTNDRERVSDDYADTVRVQILQVRTAVFQGFHGGAESKLAVGVRPALFFLVEWKGHPCPQG